MSGAGSRGPSLARWLLSLLFPPRCALCRRDGAPLCADCLGQMLPYPDPRCPRCDRTTQVAGTRCARCRRGDLAGLDALRVVGPHDGTLRRAIHAFKYHPRPALAEPLAHLLAARWTAGGGDQPLDGVVPVPLHPSRQAERGFNQAAALAAPLAQTLALPLLDDALRRARETRPQVGLGRAARRQNVEGAFVARPLPGLRLLVVDDVCTSGATLEACAHALRTSGATTVWAATLARAELD